MDDKLFDSIPKLAQRQDGTLDQLSDLYWVAIRLGMYDAAECLKRIYSLESKKD